MISGLDTLTNVEKEWSIEDLYDAHDALDINAEAEKYSFEKKG